MAYDYREQYCPNKSTRESYGYSSTPTGITIHWWGVTGQQHQNVADYLCRSGGNSSAHEVISGGLVTHLVNFDMAAWHAGSTEGNGSTIGLECRPEMSSADMETVAQRCADIEIQLGRSMYYYGHRDWSATACPGTWYDQIGWIINRVNEIKSGDTKSDPVDSNGDSDMDVQYLPQTNGEWNKVAFPVECGANDTNGTSAMIDKLWFTVFSAYGNTDIVCVFEGYGGYRWPSWIKEGFSAGSWDGDTPNPGNVPSGQSFRCELTPDMEGVSLYYRNNGASVAGVMFPKTLK